MRDGRAYDALKDSLIGGLTGTLLEIGAGDGANFGRLPAQVRWLGLEPHPRRRRRLARTAAHRGRAGGTLAANAEHLPFANGSVDGVLATVVLCSVRDQGRVLAEVRRVLRPGGRFVFFEHVASPPGSWTRRLQGALAPMSRRFDGGCDPTRDTWRAIEAAGFSTVDIQWFARGGVYGPYIGGVATVGAGATAGGAAAD